MMAEEDPNRRPALGLSWREHLEAAYAEMLSGGKRVHKRGKGHRDDQ